MTTAVQTAEKRYSIDELKELAAALAEVQAAQKAQPLHGPNFNSTTNFGAFTAPGVRPDMFGAWQRPRSFLDLVSIRKSEFYNEILEVMTGVTDGNGTNAQTWCDTPPVAGAAKVAQQIYTWGKYHMGTDAVQLPELGQRKNRADVPRNILNAPPASNALYPDIMYEMPDSMSQRRYELFLLGVHTERVTETVAIQGNASTAYTSTQRGWTKEFEGIDRQVKTGYTDAVSGLAAPALDSVVTSYNAVLGSDIVDAVTETVYAVKDRSEQMGMSGTEHVILTTERQFRALAKTWSCNYDTSYCVGSAGNPNGQAASDVNARRVDMLNNRYLLVDGMQIPVVFSDGIVTDRLSTTSYKSDLYVLPVSWQGVPLLNLEYFGMDNANIREYDNFANENTTVINNGMFLVAKVNDAFCPKYEFAAKMRLILETPWLAGRVDDIIYTYTANTRSAYPSVTYAHANGGISYRN